MKLGGIGTCENVIVTESSPLLRCESTREATEDEVRGEGEDQDEQGDPKVAAEYNPDVSLSLNDDFLRHLFLLDHNRIIETCGNELEQLMDSSEPLFGDDEGI